MGSATVAGIAIGVVVLVIALTGIAALAYVKSRYKNQINNCYFKCGHTMSNTLLICRVFFEFRPKRFNSRVRMDGLESETAITETDKQ